MKTRRQSVTKTVSPKRVPKSPKRWLEAHDVSAMALSGSVQTVQNSQAVYLQLHSSSGSDNCAFLITNSPASGFQIVAASTLPLEGHTSWAYQAGTPVHLEISITPGSGVVTFWKDGSPVCATSRNGSFAGGASNARFGSRAAPGDRLLRAAFSGVQIAQATLKNNTYNIKYRAPKFAKNAQSLFKTNGTYQVKTTSKKAFTFYQ